jgi:hypothetical protein
MLKLEMTDLEKAHQIVEEAVGEMYRGFFCMREMKEYQEEFDTMGAIINMLMTDRQFLLKNHAVKI